MCVGAAESEASTSDVLSTRRKPAKATRPYAVPTPPPPAPQQQPQYVLEEQFLLELATETSKHEAAKQAESAVELRYLQEMRCVHAPSILTLCVRVSCV